MPPRKIYPELQRALDYVKSQSIEKYNRLCNGGIIDCNVKSTPEITYTRAATITLGECGGKILRDSNRKAVSILPYIKYNLNYIEQNMFFPEFWDELDDMITHEVAHIANIDEDPFTNRIWKGHSPLWRNAVEFLGYNDASVALTRKSKSKFIDRSHAIVATCPKCYHEWTRATKPKKGYVAKCPECGTFCSAKDCRRRF